MTIAHRLDWAALEATIRSSTEIMIRSSGGISHRLARRSTMSRPKPVLSTRPVLPIVPLREMAERHEGKSAKGSRVATPTALPKLLRRYVELRNRFELLIGSVVAAIWFVHQPYDWLPALLHHLAAGLAQH
jgi:hypothetical protein